MGRAFYIESVEEAAALAGGYGQLADELGVSTEEVKRWAAGAAVPECALFLRLIDLVTAASDPRGRSATAAPGAESPGNAGANQLPLEA